MDAVATGEWLHSENELIHSVDAVDSGKILFGTIILAGGEAALPKGFDSATCLDSAFSFSGKNTIMCRVASNFHEWERNRVTSIPYDILIIAIRCLSHAHLVAFVKHAYFLPGDFDLVAVFRFFTNDP